MKLLRLIVALCVGCAAIALIALNIDSLRMSLGSDERAASNAAAVAAGQAAPDRLLPASPLQFMRDRSALRDTFGTETLSAQRVVAITIILPVAELLAADESLPDPIRLPLYAAARAPARMIRYCDDVITRFATACDVARTSSQVLPDGRIEISADLAYIPATFPGDPVNVINGAFFTVAVPLHDMPDRDKPVFNAAARIDAMRTAQELCDAVRNAFGNCVVSRLELATAELWITDLERLPAGTNPQRLRATAEITVYANQSETSDERLRDVLGLLASAD
ncbi:hypothetical protein [Yoonia vestfoldensis]|uniref:hypothetical protein n=1 Tax=Yoonia vestfoldensis TaxID=245188 RepID=UPI00038047BD|nr:hypothetical protein [Yoonia vestfoldensis]